MGKHGGQSNRKIIQLQLEIMVETSEFGRAYNNSTIAKLDLVRPTSPSSL
jgi:hypothetical protein